MIALEAAKAFAGKYLYVGIAVVALAAVVTIYGQHERIAVLKADKALLQTELSTAEDVNKGEVRQVNDLTAQLTKVTDQLKTSDQAAKAAAADAEANKAKLDLALAAQRSAVNNAKKDPHCAQALAQDLDALCPGALAGLRGSTASH